MATVCSFLFLVIYSNAPTYVGKMVKGDSCFSLLDGKYFTIGFLGFSGILLFQFFSLGALLCGSNALTWPRVVIIGSSTLIVLGIAVNSWVNCVFGGSII
jgi:hypothetical protein